MTHVGAQLHIILTRANGDVVRHTSRQRSDQRIWAQESVSAAGSQIQYMMSASPPKETDVEPAAQSPGNSEHMERDPQDPQAQGLAYEFEVKEQDRWLPIANGWSSPCSSLCV